MLTSLRASAAALALMFAAAAHAGPQFSGLYLGEVGAGNKVLMSLKAGEPSTRLTGAAPATLAGEYHYARIWSQDRLELAGEIETDRRVVIRETLVGKNGQRRQSGEFRGKLAPDGGAITGNWVSSDGRRAHAFALVRAAEWVTQSVKADGGVRSCERPRFFDPRYTGLNNELAEACDYFLADGHEGPGRLALEIDSVTGSVVAAIAYATVGGHELPPEVITVDLAAGDSGMPAALPAAVAARQ